MQKITSNVMGKVATVVTGLAIAASVLSIAPVAQAASLTSAQVQSILSLLSSFGADSSTIANVQAALTGGTMTTTGSMTTTTSSCSVGTTPLTIGSTGPNVTALQEALLAAGYSIPAGATGYFGSETQAAVAAWQTAVGVSPAAGYFGPISMAHWNLSCGGSTTTTTTTTTTSTVPGCVAGANFSTTTGDPCNPGTTTTTTGGVGYLTNITSLGDVTSDLNEGDASTPVVGFSATATNGNVTIQRVQATFTVCGAGTVTPGTVNLCMGTNDSQSINLNKYVSDISLWDGSTEIGDVNPTSASLNGRVWTVLFSGLNSVIPEGTTANFHVQVTPLSSIGINENDETVYASLLPNSVNAVGSDGISDTYISTEIDQAFTVSSAVTGTLTVSDASDNPNASIVEVGSSTTTGVKLLSFNMQAKNQAETINNLVVGLGISNNSNSVSNVVNTVYLEQGGTVIASKTASSGSYNTITFNNINQTIPENSTEDYDIVADLKPDSQYSDGTWVEASTTVSGWTVSDANGDTVTPTSVAGGNPQTLSASGISVVLGTPSATDVPTTISGQGDTGDFVIPFTVTAGDNDIYISATPGMNHAAGDIDYGTTTSSNSGVTNQGVANLSASAQQGGGTQGDTAQAYRVPANTSRTFTLSVTYTATSTGYTGLQLTDIYYGTSATSLTSDFTSNITTFQTQNINLVKH